MEFSRNTHSRVFGLFQNAIMYALFHKSRVEYVSLSLSESTN